MRRLPASEWAMLFQLSPFRSRFSSFCTWKQGALIFLPPSVSKDRSEAGGTGSVNKFVANFHVASVQSWDVWKFEQLRVDLGHRRRADRCRGHEPGHVCPDKLLVINRVFSLCCNQIIIAFLFFPTKHGSLFEISSNRWFPVPS